MLEFAPSLVLANPRSLARMRLIQQARQNHRDPDDHWRTFPTHNVLGKNHCVAERTGMLDDTELMHQDFHPTLKLLSCLYLLGLGGTNHRIQLSICFRGDFTGANHGPTLIVFLPKHLIDLEALIRQSFVEALAEVGK